METDKVDRVENVIISAGWSPGAYDIVRSLAMAKLPSCVASSQPNDIAFHSRSCAEKIVLPNFSPENYPEILVLLKTFSEKSKDRPVLFYASDPELWFVWRYRDQLPPYFRFLVPPN